jgi:ribosomal protein S18 acetylase RimI-like enzyme
MTALRFAVNESTPDQVLSHLAVCAPHFDPPLDHRVALPEYAARLAAQADRFECWSAAQLVGLVAVYCNAHDRGDAFVSNVSVDPRFARIGIAARLMAQAINHARGRAFARMSLQVSREAEPAAALYHKLGFAVNERSDGTFTMTLDLMRK